MPESQAAWQRLGEMLERRRVELDTRYANLTRFSEERGIDYRLAWDIEHAARINYRRPTLTALEVAYGWRPGSIRLALAGRQPVPEESDSRPDIVREHWDDENIQALWALNVSVDQRLSLIEVYVAQKLGSNGDAVAGGHLAEANLQEGALTRPPSRP